VGAKKTIDVVITVDGKKDVFVCKQDLFESNLTNIINRNGLSGFKGDRKLKECMGVISVEGANRLYGIVKNQHVDSVIIEIENYDYPYYAKNMNVLELKLYKDILDTYNKAKLEFKCDPGFDLQLLTRFGGVKICRWALDANAQSEDFRKLLESGCPGLTVEGIILKPEYSELFTEEEKSVAAYSGELDQ